MTVFKTQELQERGYSPTFRLQGQVYYAMPSIRPAQGQQPRFVQVYFMGDYNNQSRIRENNIPETKFDVILQLTEFLHNSHNYVRNIKTALQKVNGQNTKLVIRADIKPAEGHQGQFNAPATNEVAVIMTGDTANPRDIVITMNDGQLWSIRDTNRAYDCLQ